MRKAPLVVLVVVAVGGLVGCRKDEEKKASPMAEMAKKCAHDSEISCPHPIFSVADLKASERYYKDALGFKLDWDYGDPPTFGSVSRGDGVLFLCQQCQGQPGAWVMLFVRDIDKLHEELVERGARIRMPPTDMPWGLREMNVSDLDGNVLRFGASTDH